MGTFATRLAARRHGLTSRPDSSVGFLLCTVLAALLLHCPEPVFATAQPIPDCPYPGHLGPLDAETLARLLRNPSPVSGHELEGADLVRVLTSPDPLPPEIRLDCVAIVGGLLLRNGRRTPLSSLQPADWSPAETRSWYDTMQRSTEPATALVPASVSITRATIEPRHDSAALDGSYTFFRRLALRDVAISGNVEFSFSTFQLGLELADVTISGRTFFFGTYFAGGLDLARSEFNDTADITDTTFLDLASVSACRFAPRVTLLKSQFHSSLSVEGSDFLSQVWINSDFLKGARFEHTNFHGAVQCSGSFRDHMAFYNTRCHHELAFAELNGSGDFSLSSTRVDGDLSLFRSSLKGEIYISRATVGGSFRISNTESGRRRVHVADSSLANVLIVDSSVPGGIEVDGTRVPSGAVVMGSKLGLVEVRRAKIRRGFSLVDSSLRDLKFNDARLQGGVIIHRTSTSAIVVELSRLSSLQIIDAHVGNIRFWKVYVNDGGMIWTSKVGGPAKFHETQWTGDLSIFEVIFEDEVSFRGLGGRPALRLIEVRMLGPFIDFRGVHLKLLAFNSADARAIVAGRCDFRGAKLGSTAFREVTFEGPVTFADAVFGMDMGTEEVEPSEPRSQRTGPTTVFREVAFDKDVDFAGAVFEAPTMFERVTVAGEAGFENVAFPTPEGQPGPVFGMSYVRFAKLRLRWDSLPPLRGWARHPKDWILAIDESLEDEPHYPIGAERGPQELSKVAAGLEESLLATGLLDEANQARLDSKDAEWRESLERGRWSETLAFGLVRLFWGIPSGYGTRLVRTAIVWLSAWMVFTLIYWCQLRAEATPSRGIQNRRAVARRPATDAARLSGSIMVRFWRRDTGIENKRTWLGRTVLVQRAAAFYLGAILLLTVLQTRPFFSKIAELMF